MPTHVTEIADDTYRISTFVAEASLQMNQYLVNDDEPPLFHTGMRSLYPRNRPHSEHRAH